MNRWRAIVSATVGAGLLMTALITPMTPASAAGDEFDFMDHFSSGQYSGNEGSVDYDGSWWETLDSGGSKKGAVAVVDKGNCPQRPCARIAGEGELWGVGLARRANTEDAATATLRFTYRLVVDKPSDGRLDIVAFGGSNWKVLDTIYLTSDDAVHTRTYDVIDYAARFFTVGFFASGEWRGGVYIDDVEVSGTWMDPSTNTEPSTTSTTTTSSTTTTTTTTTTTISPPSVTITAPPAPATTAVPPPTTSEPPAVTTTTKVTRPRKTEIPPVTSVPTTTRAPSTEPPLTDDERYKDKGALAFLYFDDDLTNATGELATMPGEASLPEPGPVTQIMASLTVTAVTIRSQLLSAIVLGLLIAAAALIGLGRREAPVAES